MAVREMIVAAVLLAAPTIAFADPPASPAPIPVTASKAKDPDKLICKSIEQIGSLIQQRRICITAAQWKEYEYRAGQWTERMSSTRWLFGGS